MTKILVIDDEPSILNLIAAYLKPDGYEINPALDEPSGLYGARTFKPDLIILDFMLPAWMAASCFPVCVGYQKSMLFC